MKLFKTVVLYDVIVVAETRESAEETLKQWIADAAIVPSEAVALESSREGEIRPAWRNRSPLVAADISEADFVGKIKGKTSIELWREIYTKEAPAAPTPTKGSR